MWGGGGKIDDNDNLLAYDIRTPMCGIVTATCAQ